MKNNKELSVFINCWWRISLSQPAKASLQCTKCLSFNIFLWVFCFLCFVWYPSNKGHKTFLRKEAVVAQLLENGFGPENEGYPRKFLLSFPCCCHVSHSWAFFVPLCRISCCQVLHLLSLSLSEKQFLTISIFQGYDHMDLKSLIGLEEVYLNGSAGLSSGLP